MPVPQAGWMPIKLLSQRFAANIAALGGRDPAIAARLSAWAPSSTYHIRTDHQRIVLGTGEPGNICALPQIMSPGSALATQDKLFPAGNYHEVVLVAGEDLGWLWNSLYEMKCVIPSLPGYRVPVFFLMRDLERFWVILHIQDWRTLLADSRVRLFLGEDCLEQFRVSMLERVMCQWPALAVAIDPKIWPAGVTLDTFHIEGRAWQIEAMGKLKNQFDIMHADLTPARLADLFASGRPLRVLGITSRFSTFIQYSMRDWLEAIGRLGHQTQLLIETADHELANNLAVASACAEFKPDLIVTIDHFRQELAGVPPKVPVVMWVQDRLPNIYCPQAGQQQARLDYTIGHSFLELTQTHGYPVSRFMPTMMAVNETRFAPRTLTSTEIARYGCEVSFVTNCTTSADQIVADAMKAVGSPLAIRLIDGIYQRLRAIYDAGGSLTSGAILRSLMQRTMIDQRVNTEIDGLFELFSQKINNALFRHQAIRWVAHMGVDLHLYGKGWENNLEFGRYARGVADNQTQLPLIYQASAINLQVTPFGAVHQRLLDGLAAGGFFLLRSTIPDELELILRDMDIWCRRNSIRSGREMIARQDADLQVLTRRYAELSGNDPMNRPDYYFGALGECSLSGWTRTANTLWENSDLVTFNSREQVQSQVRHFLAAPRERREIARSMRHRVLETHTYESITRKMLKFIGDDLQEFGQSSLREAA